jgi:hypothetical protein
MRPADRYELVDALTQLAISMGWLPILAESSDRMVAITVRPRVMTDEHG